MLRGARVGFALDDAYVALQLNRSQLGEDRLHLGHCGYAVCQHHNIQLEPLLAARHVALGAHAFHVGVPALQRQPEALGGFVLERGSDVVSVASQLLHLAATRARPCQRARCTRGAEGTRTSAARALEDAGQM